MFDNFIESFDSTQRFLQLIKSKKIRSGAWSPQYYSNGNRGLFF